MCDGHRCGGESPRLWVSKFVATLVTLLSQFVSLRWAADRQTWRYESELSEEVCGLDRVCSCTARNCALKCKKKRRRRGVLVRRPARKQVYEGSDQTAKEER